MADNKENSNFKPWLRDPFAFASMHKRQAWLLRVSTMTNVALAFVVILMISLVTSLMPLKEIRVALLRVDEADNRIYRVEPVSKYVSGFDLLMEQMAKRYVRLILEIDEVSQTDRLQEAFLYTGDAFYNRFRKERIESGEIQKAIDSGLNRSIVVESADLVSDRDEIRRYAVDFVQIDKRQGKETERRNLRAYLAMTTKPHEARESEKYDNPLGIRIIDMSLKERGN
jgi:type IV secretion system protein VirB8